MRCLLRFHQNTDWRSSSFIFFPARSRLGNADDSFPVPDQRDAVGNACVFLLPDFFLFNPCGTDGERRIALKRMTGCGMLNTVFARWWVTRLNRPLFHWTSICNIIYWMDTKCARLNSDKLNSNKEVLLNINWISIKLITLLFYFFPSDNIYFFTWQYRNAVDFMR